MRRISGRSAFLECTTTASIATTSSLISPARSFSPTLFTCPSRSTTPTNNKRPMRQRHNPVRDVAFKLNAITQDLFVCGTPRRSGKNDMIQRLHLLVDDNLQSQQRQMECLLDEDGESDDPMGGDAGIEVDTEGSLRPAYELYRV